MRLIVFDTESTARHGQICQLAYLILSDNGIQGKNCFFAVDSMSEHAQSIHGMGIDALLQLSDGKRFSDCAAEILSDFANADCWIGHNVSADVRMLQLEADRLSLALPVLSTFCTMNHFTPILKLKRPCGPGSPKPPKLTELCAYYGVDDETIARCCREWFGGGDCAHDARFDAAATCLCILEAEKKGDLTWPQSK